jgi:predicted dehydrogenase
MKMRIAVIGVGRNGHQFVRAYGESPHVREIVIAEPSERLRREYGGLPKVVKAYATGEEFFDEDGADVVSIHTPSGLHRGPFVEAARRGCHLFIEKPFAENLDDITAMVEAAAANRGRAMAVGHNYRLESYSPQIKGLVEEGALGDLVCIRAGYIADYIYQWVSEPPSVYNDPRAFITRRQAILDGACHHIDLANWWTGSRPVRVTSARRPMEVEGHPTDWIASLFQYDGGALLHMDACWGAVVPHKPHFGIEIYGTRGSIRDGALHRFTSREYHRQPYEAIPLRPVPEHGHSFDREAVMFLDAVVEGKAVPVTVGEGANAAAAAICAAESARLGHPVEVPDFRRIAEGAGLSGRNL